MNLRQAQRALADVMAMCQEAHVQLPVDPLDGLFAAAEAVRHSRKNDKLELQDALDELTQVFGIDPVFQQHQKDEEQKRLNRQKRGGALKDAEPPRKSRIDTIKRQNPAKNVANQEIANQFVDLGGYELAHGEPQKGISRMRAAKQVRGALDPITSGAQASQLPGIGPSAAAKIDEVLEHGKMRALEAVEKSPEDK